MKTIRLGEVEIGPGKPPYVIAEVGSNHNGDMNLCRQLIDAAAHAGAHAVKFQSWTDKSLIAEEEYARNTEYSDKKRHFGSLREMVTAYQLTASNITKPTTTAGSEALPSARRPFSLEEVDLLEELSVPFFKIASMDIVHLPLLKYVARKQRPVLISTGMATLAEIERAVDTIRAEGNEQIVLLHCVSIYPPEYETIHLRNMATLQAAFDVPVGFSDHTLGTAIPLAAIALGACCDRKTFHTRSEHGRMGPRDFSRSRATANNRRRRQECFQSVRRKRPNNLRCGNGKEKEIPPEPCHATYAQSRARADRGRSGCQAPRYRDRTRRTILCRRPAAQLRPGGRPGPSLGAF